MLNRILYVSGSGQRQVIPGWIRSRLQHLQLSEGGRGAVHLRCHNLIKAATSLPDGSCARRFKTRQEPVIGIMSAQLD